MVDKILKWFGVAWSILAAVALSAFFFGGEWSKWESVKTKVLSASAQSAGAVSSADLGALSEKISKLEARLNGLKLIAVDANPSQPYGCGAASTAESGSLVVMSGIQDGTGCEGKSINYYKRLELVIPN